MQLDTLNRRSRHARFGGRPIEIHDLSDEDIELFGCLDPKRRYKFLPASYLGPLTNRSKVKVLDRFAELARAPNLYVRVIPEVRDTKNNNTQFHFELWRNGVEALRQRAGFEGRVIYDDEEEDRDVVHQSMIDTTLASIEIQIKRDTRARFGFADEIIAGPKFPQEQRRQERPLTIPVDIEWKNPHTEKAFRKKFKYTNDGTGFIEFTVPGSEPLKRYFQIEAENGNPVERSNIDQWSSVKKFLAVKQIMENGLHTKHWGMGNLLTLFLFPSHRREEAIPRFKAAILRETNGKGASYILMRRVDTLGRTLNPMDLYTGPWERAGYPPFYLNKLEKQ